MERAIGEIERAIEAVTANEVRFTLPSLPVTVNSLYQIRYSTREVFLRPECYRWKSESKRYVPRFKVAQDSSVEIHATYHFPFHYKNGKPRVFDVANLLKLTIDTIAEKCGFNDFLVRAGSWDAVDSTEEKVEVVVRERVMVKTMTATTATTATTT
jgi:hypothetical protein